MTTISIAMATYNGARFIREQLDSLSAQSVPPLELVIADDGSNDGTLDIIADFSITAPFPVRVYRNEVRLNYRANFMKCAGWCSGDIIAFCDQDDIWDENKIETLALYFERADADLVFHDFRLIDTAGNPITDTTSDSFPSIKNPWIVVRGLTLAFRRTLLKYSDLWELSVDQQYPEERLAHDQWFVFLAHAFNSLDHLSRPLLSYRQHEANVFGFKDISKQLDIGMKGNLRAVTQAIIGRPYLARTKRDILFRQFLGRALGSKSRLEILAKIDEREGKSRETDLQVKIDSYRSLARSYRNRTSIYEHSDVKGRLKCFYNALGDGAYTSNGRGFRDAILDIIYGVCIAPSSASKTTVQEVGGAN
jgi:glycosyltransferase involved in cell wall biosynthesis